jgi:hypothetical protein
MSIHYLWHPRSLYLLPWIMLSFGFWAAAQVLPPTNWSASPFNPPSLPLAVKTPYLNAWAPLAGGSAAVNAAWPRSFFPLINVSDIVQCGRFNFWRVQSDSGMVCFNTDWRHCIQAAWRSQHPERPGGYPKAIHFHPDSNFIFAWLRRQSVCKHNLCDPNRGKLSRTLWNLSARILFIQAMDLVRLSTPFSYLQVIATSSDGQPHNVQVYSDVSGGESLPLMGWSECVFIF